MSTVRVKLADGIPVLPAASVAVAVNLCGPSGSAFGGVNVHVPSGWTVVRPNVVPLSATVMVAPGSPVPERTGVVLFVLPPFARGRVAPPISPSPATIIGAAGGVVSMVNAKLAGVLALPAASVATAVSVCGPSLSG